MQALATDSGKVGNFRKLTVAGSDSHVKGNLGGISATGPAFNEGTILLLLPLQLPIYLLPIVS